MRLIFSLLIFVILFQSCSNRSITFDVTYEIHADQMSIEDGYIVIRDFPLFFQSQVEKNFTKKSQVKSISLLDIKSNTQLNIRKMELKNGSSWNPITIDTLFENNNDLHQYQFIDCKADFLPIFKEDKLNLRIPFHLKQIPTTLLLTFRMKGKYDKTNVQYRIVA